MGVCEFRIEDFRCLFLNRGGSCESKVEVSFGFRVFGLGIVCFCFRRRVAGSVGRRTRECRVSK